MYRVVVEVMYVVEVCVFSIYLGILIANVGNIYMAI